MSDQPHSISEDDLGAVLTAYLDGELTEPKVREVEQILARHEPARRLLAQLEAVSPALPDLYQSILDQAVPDRLVEAIESHPGDGASTAGPAPGDRVVALPPRPARRSVLTRIAASVALLAAGGAGGFLARDTLRPPAPPAKPGWIEQVAQYHSVYGREKRHLVEVGADQIDHIKAWLGKRMNRENLVADLSPLGLEFKGARLLVINGKHVAQLMYLAEGGRPVGFCIINTPKQDAPFKADRKDDLNLVSWRSSGYGFVVVGWDQPQELRGIAEAVAAQMENTT